MYNPNINSTIINPLTVAKPTYADPTIEDMYLDTDDAPYELGVGYKQQFYIVLVKRITADIVRKHRCPFPSRQDAVRFMYGLCTAADAETRIQSAIAAVAPVTPPQEQKERTEDGTTVKKRVFSFYDD